jgi:hypothetical protein
MAAEQAAVVEAGQDAIKRPDRRQGYRKCVSKRKQAWRRLQVSNLAL